MSATPAPYVLVDSVGPLGVRRVTIAYATSEQADLAAAHPATLTAVYTRRVLTVETTASALAGLSWSPATFTVVARLAAFGWHRDARFDAVDRELHLGRPVPAASLESLPATVRRWSRFNVLDLLTATLEPAVPRFGGEVVLALAAVGRLAEPEVHLDPAATAGRPDLTDAVLAACLLWLTDRRACFQHVAVALAAPHTAGRAWATLAALLAAQPPSPASPSGLELLGRVRYPDGDGPAPVVLTLDPPAGEPDPCA